MANLVPLHVDKDTGRIIARGGAGGFGRLAEGFLYEQLIASDNWVIPHNKANDRVLIQVYDDLGLFTLPDEIIIVDINNVQIVFNEPMTGTAHIFFFRSS